MKVLVDTNVVLDVLLKRTPFYKDSLTVYQLSENRRINEVLASVSMTNAFYVLRKAGKSQDEVYQEIDKLAIIFFIAPITQTTISDALALRWKDFEDAVQYIAAKESKVEFIITRNKSDYLTSDIPCLTPTEFIARLKQEEDTEKNG